jgi:hypothetical protein
MMFNHNIAGAAKTTFHHFRKNQHQAPDFKTKQKRLLA